ncbi:alpha/beta fold hydrolase [Actinoplanes sp. M2I2]|uniref:alpha/beta fold hydrolase n=1 Tax=Actinoplanes sp. M2I2 TaxID=1734444 RepID=UPI0020213205|nr:alpha/beta hydrolase [Actinoplanes sp. M2I2]
MSTHHTILCLSGAGLPAWIWDDVQQLLGGSDHVAVAARPTRIAGAGLRDYAEAALGSAPAGRFAVVAHSAGGVVGAEIARLAPDRVSAFLAVTAVIPEPGGSFLSTVPAPNRWVLRAAMRFAGTRPPDAAIRRGLAYGLENRTTDRIIADFAPESAALYSDKVARRPWNVRRGYVFTEADRELPMAMQRRSAQRLGPEWTNQLDTGHLPMIENPRALAGSITEFLAADPDVDQTGHADQRPSGLRRRHD